MKEISIVIPCLNEEKTLPIVIGKCLSSFSRLHLNGEILVSDNGSTDKSMEIAQKLGARVIFCKEKGYGNALICGIKNIDSFFIIIGDADDSYNFEEIDEFIKYLRQGFDLVMGSRFKGKIEKGAMPFLHRYLGTPILTLFIRLLFKIKISDCNCGMRGFSKECFERLNLESSGMEFASEMLIKAGILKMNVKEIPINLYKDKRDRVPHLHTWRDGWRHLRYILLFAPDFLFIWPSLIFFMLGNVLMFIQINGPFSYKWIYMDIHFMLLGLTFSLIGIFVFQSGLLIKSFSHLNDYFGDDFLIKKFRKFKLENGLIIGGSFLFLGILIDFSILFLWINNHLHNIYYPRATIFGLYFIFLGISIIAISFFRAIMFKDK